MSISSIVSNISAWLKCNLIFLSIQIARLTIKVLPCKIFLLKVLGYVSGLITMFLNINCWKPIINFAKHTGSTMPGWIYVLRYYLQNGLDKTWTHIYYEAAPSLGKYIRFENWEILEKTIAEGKGAILLGAHYGPGLSGFLLNEMNIKFKQLVGKDAYIRWENDFKLGIKPLISKRNMFLRDSNKFIMTKKSEKEFIRHLKSGEAVIMQIDVLSRTKREKPVDFFNIPTRFYYFPFKLALRYEIPVYFVFFKKDQHGGYRYCIAPFGDFSTQEEGVMKYASFFQSLITSYPFMWYFVPDFFDWFKKQP